MTSNLSPSQQTALEMLRHELAFSPIVVLYGDAGAGKSTMLHEVQREFGGAFLNMVDYSAALRRCRPEALEEAFTEMVLEKLQQEEMAIVDDLHLINNIVCCNHFYQRRGLLDATFAGLCTFAAEANKKLVFGTENNPPISIHQRAFYSRIEDFTARDYEFICRQYLSPELAAGLDYDKIHRFATKLNGYQLKSACVWHRLYESLSTEQFIDYLRSQRLASNVDLSEVRAAKLEDLKGIDDVIESLEANIVLPLENDELATELALKSRRGVLLAGPPGTGKTTVGRALAHRLKGKFFLIDGTFIAGTEGFYKRINHVFEAAQQSAPSVIFIDDSDAIFEGGEELGLYRYLLTMLDGLESESAGRVCVILTAMDVVNLPPALIRSGRIELWLEMRLPNAEARANILSTNFSQLTESLAGADVEHLVAATENFSGADLTRLVEDGKALYGYDRSRGKALKSPTEYFLSAVETVRANKERYTKAEARVREQRPSRPAWYQTFRPPAR